GEGWSLVLDARGAAALRQLADELPAERTIAIAGDVTDPWHRGALLRAVDAVGGVDLLVNNASELGPSPLPRLADYPVDALGRVLDTDVLAPLALIQLLLPSLSARGGIIVNVSSDAAVTPFAGWGGYGAAKAALDHLSSVLALERPDVRSYAFDPGDMRTAMHQAAFPGEDISDRPEPETVVPALLRLLHERPASGRYRAAQLLAAEAVA
ncbi:MAG TPA: SDR family NAD(P)-dependent oxidoreductase, partial [Longimicrobiales bacterium]